MDEHPFPLPEHVSFPDQPAGACPACEGQQTRSFYSVSSIPIHSCVLLESAQLAREFPTGDLRLAVCSDCGFVFNELFDPSRIDYKEDYEETQGYSGTFRAFLAQLINGLAAGRDLSGKTLLEIGCGRGDFLEQLCEATGAQGVGIDPSQTSGRVKLDAGAGLRFEQVEYGPQHFAVPAAGILCRHTLEHIPDVQNVVGMIRAHLEEQGSGWTFFEVPDTERILKEGAYWDVYYEHCSYFSVGSLARLFERCGFSVLDLVKVYGEQYLHLIADLAGPASQAAIPSAKEVVDWAGAFGETCRQSLSQWHTWLGQSAPGSVALWGSGSKATGFLTTLGSWDRIAFVVDINPQKHGKFVAGSGHEIVKPEALVDSGVRRVLIMNPIYEREINEQIQGLGLDLEIRCVG